jgi:hypothetical protein
MGSFADTCCVSGLPIEAGDEVRYFLLMENPYCSGGFVCESYGRWVPRTWPIKARYNDYGSIEDWEEGPVMESFMQGLQLDLVEVGVGDNSIHDVSARKDMTFPQLLEAIWEGRVKVEREVGMRDLGTLEGDESHEPPAYHPTMAHVEEQLATVKLPEKGRFLVDEQEDYTRVRWDGLSADYGKDETYLGQARAVLDETFATVLMAGSGSYSNVCELRVFVAPGKDTGGHSRRANFRRGEFEKPPLLIQQAMIREDVWQALLRLPLRTWRGSNKVQDFRVGAKKGVEKMVEGLSRYADDPILRRMMLRCPDDAPGCSLAGKDIIPFTVGLHSHTLLVLGDEGEIPEGFTDLVGEFTYLFHLLMETRHVWKPSDTAGPQFGEWRAHLRYFQAMAKVAQVAADKEAEERAEWAREEEE